MRADIERWNRKFADARPVDAPAGEAELVAVAGNLPAGGLALELACGRGAGALWLATLGYDVVALDGSINALRVCADAARREALPVFPVVMDLDHAVLPEGRFRMISIVRYLNRTLFPTLSDALAPGGMLFCKTFNRRHLEAQPRFNPDYLLQDGELPGLFPGLTEIASGNSGGASWFLGRF